MELHIGLGVILSFFSVIMLLYLVYAIIKFRTEKISFFSAQNIPFAIDAILLLYFFASQAAAFYLLLIYLSIQVLLYIPIVSYVLKYYKYSPAGSFIRDSGLLVPSSCAGFMLMLAILFILPARFFSHETFHLLKLPCIYLLLSTLVKAAIMRPKEKFFISTFSEATVSLTSVLVISTVITFAIENPALDTYMPYIAAFFVLMNLTFNILASQTIMKYFLPKE